MKISPDCIVCLFQQALRTSKLATEDEGLQRKILTRVANEIAQLEEETIPIEVAGRIQELVGELTGVTDPYQDAKRRYNDLALKLYPRLKELLEGAEDPLLTAIRLAIAGNIIDFGLGSEFDLEQVIQESLTREFSIFDYEFFLEKLAAAESLLYIGDNTGEIVFDKLLIEELLRRGKQVTYVVRGGSAINDATLEDARYVGMEKIVRVITTGTAIPGTILKDASSDFVTHFQTADLIIAKGQGNFEGLDDEPGPITFLLKAKCTLIANELGVEPGAMVLYLKPGIKESGFIDNNN
ncbi:DUF89 family protein [Pleurocapsales cyanobacterium LEGE 10410]|nr:DUF89 family protein [Pleurocapsales cyanobacterium LEGE 10410]